MKNFSEYEDYLMDKFSLIINQYSGADLTSVEVSSLLDWKVDGYIKRQQSSKFFYKKRMKDLQKTLIDVVM